MIYAIPCWRSLVRDILIDQPDAQGHPIIGGLFFLDAKDAAKHCDDCTKAIPGTHCHFRKDIGNVEEIPVGDI